MEYWEYDFSKREAEAVVRAIRNFCTSSVSGFDEGLFEHMRSAIQIYVSDGCPAALKTGRVLKQTSLRNIAFMTRDLAHAIRTEARDPLHAEFRIEYFWVRVFDSKHALNRNIQSS